MYSQEKLSFFLLKAGSKELCWPCNFLFLVTLRKAKACQFCVISCIISKPFIMNCVLVLLFYTVSPISIENQSQKIYGHFLRMGFNCLKATEPQGGESLLFTSKSPRVPGTQFINLGNMIGWVEAESSEFYYFWIKVNKNKTNPWILHSMHDYWEENLLSKKDTQ